MYVSISYTATVISLSLFIPFSGVCISALYKLDPLPLFQASLVLLLSSHLMSSV